MLTHIETSETRSGVSIKYKIKNTPKDTTYEVAVTEYLGTYNIAVYMNDQFWIEEVEIDSIPEGLAVKVSDAWIGLDIICSKAIYRYEDDKLEFFKPDTSPEVYASSVTARY